MDNGSYLPQNGHFRVTKLYNYPTNMVIKPILPENYVILRLSVFIIDLYKFLVVLWIVNTVNELLHLKSFTKTLSTYPAVLKLFQNLKSILYEP